MLEHSIYIYIYIYSSNKLTSYATAISQKPNIACVHTGTYMLNACVYVTNKKEMSIHICHNIYFVTNYRVIDNHTVDYHVVDYLD